MKLTFVFCIMLVMLGAVVSARARYNCICTADYTPVCGKNGYTYSNICRLECSGVQLDYKGECGSNI